MPEREHLRTLGPYSRMALFVRGWGLEALLGFGLALLWRISRRPAAKGSRSSCSEVWALGCGASQHFVTGWAGLCGTAPLEGGSTESWWSVKSSVAVVSSLESRPPRPSRPDADCGSAYRPASTPNKSRKPLSHWPPPWVSGRSGSSGMPPTPRSLTSRSSRPTLCHFPLRSGRGHRARCGIPSARYRRGRQSRVDRIARTQPPAGW